jgi:hypothetical protein
MCVYIEKCSHETTVLLIRQVHLETVYFILAGWRDGGENEKN